MFKNYLKIAFRNIHRNKVYSFINIAGLAIGLASCFIILIYVVNELSYDRYNKKLDDIYTITTTKNIFKKTEFETPFLLGKTLKEQYPQIKQYARFVFLNTNIKYEEKNFGESPCVYADPSLFNILTLPIEIGNSNLLSSNIYSAVISHETARKYFENNNPIGKILNVQNDGGAFDVKIVGVMKNIPKTSTFQADIILPLYLAQNSLKKHWGDIYKNPLESRSLTLVNTYLLLNHGSNVIELQKQLNKFSKNYSDPDQLQQFRLFPVKDIYFHSKGMSASYFPTGDISKVYIYSIIGLMILLIACINIIILNTGKASTRTREIGVRKVIGASRFNLIRQILIETLVVAFLSLILAVVLVEIFLPNISILLGKELPSDYFHSWQFILMFFGAAFLVGIFSGGYIAFYLSGFQPIDILKNKITVGSGKTVFRKILITAQMIIFIGLIIALTTINKQMQFFHNKDFGFNKNNLVVFESDIDNNIDWGKNFNAFKNELKENPNIIGVTGGIIMPETQSYMIFPQANELDPTKKVIVEGLLVDKDFFEVMGMKIIQGKSFAGLSKEELKNTFIINETAQKELSIKNPIGDMLGNMKIIGVVKDFNMHSLRKIIQPMAISAGTEGLNEIVVRIRPEEKAKTIKFIQTKSKEFNNGKPMNYEFFDQRIDSLYRNEKRFSEMMEYFTMLAIFIACLGLFGMSLFVSQQRVKEIGIRKVLGASTGNIFYLLTRELIFLTIISTIVAAPVSAYFTNKWLQNFAYRININVWIYIIAGISALLIAIIAVSYQAIKAAMANPVKSLRYE